MARSGGTKKQTINKCWLGLGKGGQKYKLGVQNKYVVEMYRMETKIENTVLLFSKLLRECILTGSKNWRIALTYIPYNVYTR